MSLLYRFIHKEDFIFLMMGFFVFSSMSSVILIDYLHFPIALPELLLFPFAYLLKNIISTIKIYKSDISKVLFLIVLWLIIGIINGEMTLISMLSYSRSWLYIILLMIAFKRDNDINNSHLLFLSFGSLIGWLIASRLNFENIMQNVLNSEGEVDLCTYGTMLSVPIFLSLTMKRGLYKMFAIGFVILIITMLLANLRRLIAVGLISVFLSLFFILLKDKRKLPVYLLVGSIIVFVFLSLLPSIEDFVANVSPEMHARTFRRLGNMLETGSTGTDGDDVRKGNIVYAMDNIFDYVLPKGMIGKTGDESYKVFAPFIDFPMMMLFYLFGFIVTIFILLRMISVLLRNFYKYSRYSDETSMVSCITIVVMFVMLFLEGTFLYFPYAAPLTGILLGRAIRNTKNPKIIIR